MKLRHILALTYLISFAVVIVAQEAPDLETLFRQLQSSDTADKARQVLVKRAQTDAGVKIYLSTKLPDMIEKGGKGTSSQWTNAVRLAGELKITEAAPALAKWIGIDNVGDTTIAQYMRLETNPAGKALSEIGDPAIPALTEVLNHGTIRERRAAFLALNLIGSPHAKATIRDQLSRETDPKLREFAEKLVTAEPPSRQ